MVRCPPGTRSLAARSMAPHRRRNGQSRGRRSSVACRGSFPPGMASPASGSWRLKNRVLPVLWSPLGVLSINESVCPARRRPTPLEGGFAPHLHYHSPPTLPPTVPAPHETPHTHTTPRLVDPGELLLAHLYADDADAGGRSWRRSAAHSGHTPRPRHQRGLHSAHARALRPHRRDGGRAGGIACPSARRRASGGRIPLLARSARGW